MHRKSRTRTSGWAQLALKHRLLDCGRPDLARLCLQLRHCFWVRRCCNVHDVCV